MTLKEYDFAYEGKSYKMRESNGAEDLIYQEQCTGPDGRIKLSELWKKRIKRCMVEPLFTDHEFNELSHKELQFLISKWLEYNELDVASFLEGSKLDQNSM